MRSPRILVNTLFSASVLLFAAANFLPGHDSNGPVLDAAVAFATPTRGIVRTAEAMTPRNELALHTQRALEVFASAVRPLSHANALESAFKSYFAYKTAHPADVRKPYLYFVDYGLPSTTPRGYVFDMDALTIIDGPFTVAHGRGSSTSQFGVPTRFSNAPGSAATSLGLYLAQATYAFRGHSGGGTYNSIGVRLRGVSAGFNDLANQRGVVTHGAPYVTPTRAGRSEGCPAMEQSRAERLLPRIAQGGMVFLFAPDEHWLSRDPWISSNGG